MLCAGDVPEFLLDARVGHEVVDDHEVRGRCSCLTEMAEDVDAVTIRPVVEDLADYEDRSVLHRLRREEVVH